MTGIKDRVSAALGSNTAGTHDHTHGTTGHTGDLHSGTTGTGVTGSHTHGTGVTGSHSHGTGVTGSHSHGTGVTGSHSHGTGMTGTTGLTGTAGGTHTHLHGTGELVGGSGKVIDSKTFTKTEDHEVLIEKKAYELQHRPIEKEYVVETRFVGEERVAGGPTELVGTEAREVEERVVEAPRGDRAVVVENVDVPVEMLQQTNTTSSTGVMPGHSSHTHGTGIGGTGVGGRNSNTSF